MSLSIAGHTTANKIWVVEDLKVRILMYFIADTTLSNMLYNILSSLKHGNEYSTIGGLFEEIDKDRLSPTIIERITQLMSSISEVMSEVFGIDLFELVEEKLSDPDFENKHLKYILKLAS